MTSTGTAFQSFVIVSLFFTLAISFPAIGENNEPLVCEVGASVVGIMELENGTVMVFWDAIPEGTDIDLQDFKKYYNLYHNNTLVARNKMLEDNFTPVSYNSYTGFFNLKGWFWAAELNSDLLIISSYEEFYPDRSSPLTENYYIFEMYENWSENTHNPRWLYESNASRYVLGMQFFKNDDFLALYGNLDTETRGVIVYNISSQEFKEIYFNEKPSEFDLGNDNCVHVLYAKRLRVGSESNHLGTFNLSYSKISVNGTVMVEKTILQPYSACHDFSVGPDGSLYLYYTQQSAIPPDDTYYETGTFLKIFHDFPNNPSNSSLVPIPNDIHENALELSADFDSEGNYHLVAENPGTVTHVIVDEHGQIIYSNNLSIVIRQSKWMVDSSGNLHLGSGYYTTKYYVISRDGQIVLNETLCKAKLSPPPDLDPEPSFHPTTIVVSLFIATAAVIVVIVYPRKN